MVHQSVLTETGAHGDVQHIALGDITVAFRRVGRGQPVVFIHGLAEDHSSWDRVLEYLPGDVEAILVDLRGHGRTTAGQGEGSVEQLARDLTRFLEETTGPAVCVGFSLGGVIVLEASLARPDLVRKAIVVGTSSKVGKAAAGFFRDRIALAQTDMGSLREALTSDTAAQVVRNRDAIDRIATKRIEAVGNGEGYVNAARAMVALSAAPMTDRLKSIAVPVHIIQGRDDVFCPIKAADMLREAMPAAGYTEIPDAGHLIAVDQPEKLARAISGVLKA